METEEFAFNFPHYAIKDTGEAVEFLKHLVLGPRLIDICSSLMAYFLRLDFTGNCLASISPCR